MLDNNRINVINDHITKSYENYSLFEFLQESNKFNEWQVTALFYSALCLVKAYIYSKPSIDINIVNSHKQIDDCLSSIKEAKQLNIRNPYHWLYRSSRDARYKCLKISQGRVIKAIEKYEEVKKLTKISEEHIIIKEKTKNRLKE